MKFLNFILISLSLIMLSCKKETSKNDSKNLETSCVCLKDNIGVPLSNQVMCNGFLNMTTYTNQSGDKPFSYVTTNAYFTSRADLQVSGDAIITVDSIYLNEQLLHSFKDAYGDHMYYQYDFNLMPLEQKWQIYGANSIPTFTFSANLKNPVADFSLVPDNLSKNLVKSFRINGVENITGGYVSIFSSEGSGYNVSVILREGSNEICFPEEQLKLVIAGKATIQIFIENITTQTFDNKNFAFSKRLQFEKNITLNP
jgi:hypothetical protein